MAAFVDSHAHLDGPEFDRDREAVLARATAAGVTHVVCIGASDGFLSNQRTLDFVEGRAGLYATVGIHPHDARILDDAMFQALEAMAAHKQVVAIGETGLDYYYDQSPRAAQLEAFRRFVGLAQATQKPLIVHTRDAEDDTLEVLRTTSAETIGGVLHCFTGSQRLADEALALGFYISFSGVLTFKNAGALREVARSLPRDRVLVETDCPYLAPVPHRGKRNEPSFVLHTCERLAELWDMPPQDVRNLTGANALRLFGICETPSEPQE